MSKYEISAHSLPRWRRLKELLDVNTSPFLLFLSARLTRSCLHFHPRPQAQARAALTVGRNFFWDHFLWELGNRACYDAIQEACTAGNRLRSNTLTRLIYSILIHITAAVLTHYSSRLSESFVPMIKCNKKRTRYKFFIKQIKIYHKYRDIEFCFEYMLV